MEISRAKITEKYGEEIDRAVRSVRKWITERNEPPSEDEILCRCEDEFFGSGLARSAGSHETVVIIDSMYRRLTDRYGILSGLLEDTSINEIMVNGPGHIYVEKDKALVRVDDAFTSCAELEEMIRMFAADVHREINEANPIVDARLPSGYRVNGVLRNVALNGPILTIRKFREKEIDMDELIGCASLSVECAEDLAALVRSGYNIFISGGTSSGKTTFLNALTAYIGESERVITIEDSAELVISHIENKVQMECRSANSIGKGEVNMTQLIRTSLRMRPDRIIVGEVRGKEVIDMIQAMNTGHDGSMSTGHGNSIRGMLNRLETMYLADSQVSVNSVRNQIANAIDVFIHLRRDAKGRRYVEEVAEMTDYNGEEYKLNYLYKADEEGILRATGNGLHDRDRLIRSGYDNMLMGSTAPAGGGEK
ncbi:MAG: CpaF family protein [Oscillospiraceae bacterium]|nr:CpaF family protein [Oscillospiraceae bacterium]